MTDGDASADDRIRELADRLAALQAALGAAYWENDEVRALQDELRAAVGRYGAWGPDRPPPHQRARRAARYERDLARLLWPW